MIEKIILLTVRQASHRHTYRLLIWMTTGCDRYMGEDGKAHRGLEQWDV